VTALGRETCGIVETDGADGFPVVVVVAAAAAAAAGFPPEVAVEAATTVFSLLSGAVLGVDEAFGCIAASFLAKEQSVWSQQSCTRKDRFLQYFKHSFFNFSFR
jgi:hypothetical protein